MTKPSDPALSDPPSATPAQSPVSCQLTSPEATTQLAKQLAAQLYPGDSLLLEGPIGAGKTHFSRSLIQSLMTHPEDVPSPTFTLVQTYEVPSGELWHADLYRLSALEEIEELGLFEAFDDAICLIEWPDRLAELTPTHALHLEFSLDPAEEDCRHLTLTWSDAKWQSRMDEIAHDRP
ncbi:tRNA (adenosine(37)-N6)-threonylcarbamoyltransferase complex ATPase subunit type 1 TsaE [Pseudophaeobacter sp. TrK17]|uniref:tRNA (adenosine(37)-N6)-threonylcarbamoyltransferase complex ATPase subunit type 1 TsaE n=1 Tax=Pseudophaeobacter sp. TrK17 TaxID=2815167 RepID=UPI0035CF8F8E